jgi:hypothetical protein
MPVPENIATQVIDNNARFFAQCREHDVPVIHLLTRYRDTDEIANNPFWRSEPTNPMPPARTCCVTTSMALRAAPSCRSYSTPPGTWS